MQPFSNQTQQACETTKMVQLLRADLEAMVEALIQRSGGSLARSPNWYAWPSPVVTRSPEVPKRMLMLGLFT